MIKTAKQLKDLIRNLSRENVHAQILMRNYMMERFLEFLFLNIVTSLS